MQDIKTIFKGINILYLALALGQILISIVLFYMSLENSPTLDMSFGDIKQLLVLLLVPAAIMISHYLYNNKITEGKQLNGVDDKLAHYRASNILRWAILEGVNLINIIFFFLSNNYFFLILFVFGFAFFLLGKPSEEGFIEDYKLNSDERQAFKKSIQ